MTIVVGSAAAPWGPICIAASERGVVAIEQLVAEHEFLVRLERRFGPRAAIAASREGRPQASDHPEGSSSARSAAEGHLAKGLTGLAAFIDGDLGALDDLPMDLDDRAGWDRQVFAAVRDIPPGATASYGQVARMVGKPGAARAVGGAVGRNPIGLAIPCHRVIAGDGTLGGYGGGWWGGREAGLALKRALLAREGVRIER